MQIFKILLAISFLIIIINFASINFCESTKSIFLASINFRKLDLIHKIANISAISHIKIGVLPWERGWNTHFFHK